MGCYKLDHIETFEPAIFLAVGKNPVDGQKKQKDYYAFGSIARTSKTNEDNHYRYGYQGQNTEEDQETGWNHFELREYDPIVGRWLSTDPYREFASPYIGMGNNPVNYTDPDGGRICTTCPDGEEYDVFRESQFIFNYSEENGVQFSALNFATGFDEGAAGFNIDLSVLSGNAYNKSGGTALSFGAEVSVLNGSIDFRAGSRALGIIAGGEGTVLSASANLDAGWFSGQRGYTGALVDANIGVYTAKGEYYGGLTLGGISFRTVVGGSVLSAHAGITGGAYYNQESGEFILEGFEHLGFGIGEKVGVKIVIPVRAYMEGKVGL